MGFIKVLLVVLFASISALAATPNFKKVFIVVLENTNYNQALAQPFLVQLAQRGALLTNYTAVAHPSYPNYLALTSGSTQGKTNDKVVVINAHHIGDLLTAKGKTWKNYAEGYPSNCTLQNVGRFAPKHVPFLSYASVRTNPSTCGHVVDARALSADIQSGNLPDYSFYTPDMDNDGHDTNAAYAARWLQNTFGPLLQDPKFMKDMLFVLTFDENDGVISKNQVYTVLYGNSVVAGSTSNGAFTHYSLLRTIEDTFGLGTLGQKDAQAIPITGIWK
jgi:phospholipase C